MIKFSKEQVLLLHQLIAEETGGSIGNIHARQLADHAQHPGGDDANQDGALDLLDVQHSGDQRADQSQQRANAVGGEIIGEAGDGNQSGRIHNQAGILQADEGDEQTDANGNTTLERQRNGVEDGFTYIGQRQDDKNKTFHKDGQQCDLPAVAEAQNHGVSQVGVQTHTCGQDEGKVCHESHTASADEGCDGSCQQHSGGVHACCGEDTGVDRQNVGHGHKGGDACNHFCFYSGAVFGQFKNFIQHF